MPISRKFWWRALGIAVAIVVIGAVVLWWMVRKEPEFYRQTVGIDPAQQQTHSDEMLRRSAALANDFRRAPRWQIVFTAQQINGWLAVDVPRNHATALPPYLHDPRVQITPQSFTLAVRYDSPIGDVVLNAAVGTSVSEQGQLIVVLQSVLAGALPISERFVLDKLSQALRQSELEVQWRQDAGAPAAIISFPPGENGARRVFERAELRDGEIFLSGRIEPAMR